MTGLTRKPISAIMLFLSCTALITSSITVHAADAAVRAHILEVSDTKKSGAYVRQRFVERMEKPFSPNDKRPKMLIMGDSHAQDFYNVLAENNVDKRYQVSTRRIPAICGVYLGTENIRPLIAKKHIPICDKADTLQNALPQIKQADVVIIADNGKLWSAQRLKTTVQNLNIKAPQKLLVVGRKNFGKLNLRQYLRMPNAKLRQLRNRVRGAQQATNQVLRQSLPAGVYIDIQGLLCRSEDDCPLFTPQARLISFDGGHLTKDGAHYIGGILLKHSPLNQL